MSNTTAWKVSHVLTGIDAYRKSISSVARYLSKPPNALHTARSRADNRDNFLYHKHVILKINIE